MFTYKYFIFAFLIGYAIGILASYHSAFHSLTRVSEISLKIQLHYASQVHGNRSFSRWIVHILNKRIDVFHIHVVKMRSFVGIWLLATVRHNKFSILLNKKSVVGTMRRSVRTRENRASDSRYMYIKLTLYAAIL